MPSLQVRGPAEKDHRVYDLWGRYWNAIDRVNEDYHAFFQLHGGKSANGWALQTLCHHIFMNARAIWEEQRAAHAYQASGRSIAAAEAVQQLTIPRFLLNAAEQARDLDLQHLR